MVLTSITALNKTKLKEPRLRRERRIILKQHGYVFRSHSLIRNKNEYIFPRVYKVEDKNCFQKNLVRATSRNIPKNAKAKFYPSNILVRLVGQNSISVDEEVRTVMMERAKYTEIENLDITNENIRDRIAVEVEGILADFAQRAAAIGENNVQLSTGNRLNEEICTEIIWGLKLDSYNPRSFLDRLYIELRAFAKIPRERWWGRITFESATGIRLEVNVAAVSNVPNLSDIGPEYWIESD